MKIKYLWLMLGCFLVLPRTAGWGAAFPSGKSFVRIQTCRDRIDIYSSAKPAIEGIGYSCGTDLTGDVTLPDVNSAGGFGAVLLWASHGGSGYVVVEQCYSSLDDANFRKTALEATTYSPGDLCAGYNSDAGMYFVGLTNQGIKNTFSGSLAVVAACYSSSTAGKWGATYEVGYADVTNGGTTQTEMTALFNSLTAEDNHDAMTVFSAINGGQSLMKGDGNIALLPWVVSFLPADYYLNQQYVTVTLTFGGSMSSVPFIVGGYAIKSSQGGSGNTWWVILQTGWVEGNVVVGIFASQGLSSNGIALKTDWSNTWYNTATGYPPAASVEAFAPILMNGGVEIHADFGQLRGSRAFWVNRQDGSLVGDTISVEELEGHTFELFDPYGTSTNRYYLYERDHRGVFLRAHEGVFENEPAIAKRGGEFDPGLLEGALRSRFDSKEACLDACSGTIVCPDSFVNSAQILANFWSTRGRSVSVVPLSQTGHSREEIKSYLADAYSDGLRYALLAGCASDYEWFDDPSKWPDYPGDNDWYYWYLDYHTPGGYYYWVSHPERNLIPTWYFADTLYDNMSYWTPYYSGDWYYGDGLPELRIGRFPAANNSQFLAMIAKDIDYTQEKSGLPWQHDVGIWGFCQSLDGNDGPLMKAIVQAFIDTIPASYQKHSLIDTNWTYIQRETQGLADWNAGRGTIWMQGTSSTAYKVNHFFSKAAGWHIGKLDVGKLALLIGANCGIGAYDLALNPTYGEPVAQDLLGSASNRGAWGLIAPTRGTWIEGDRQMCYALNKYFSLQPVEDIGTAFMLAQREVRGGNGHQCAESFNLLGDPMAPVPTQEVTEVQEQIPDRARLRLYPNPFNPSVTIEYDVPRSCLVDLTIYNVKGQKVCHLVNEVQDEGEHSLVWRAVDEGGRRVSSGVYFCKLQVGAHRELRKVVLVR